jgi:hypothetical protein
MTDANARKSEAFLHSRGFTSICRQSFFFTLCTFAVLSGGCVEQNRKAGISEDQETVKVTELIRRIDENPDRLHIESTPAVHELIDIGPAAIEPVLGLMLDDLEVRRQRGQRVLQEILVRMYGYEPGIQWANTPNQRKYLAKWESLGLEYDTELSARRKGVEKWKHWLGNGAPID